MPLRGSTFTGTSESTRGTLRKKTMFNLPSYALHPLFSTHPFPCTLPLKNLPPHPPHYAHPCTPPHLPARTRH